MLWWGCALVNSRGFQARTPTFSPTFADSGLYHSIRGLICLLVNFAVGIVSLTLFQGVWCESISGRGVGWSRNHSVLDPDPVGKIKLKNNR